jgi:uncharacterized protein with PIN domain
LTAIVVDTSAVVAILRDEPEKDRFVDAILAASPRLMSAVSVQEAGMVIAGGTAARPFGSRLTHYWFGWTSKLSPMTRLSHVSRGWHFFVSAKGAIPPG